MQSRSHKASFTLLLIGALVALVATLAILQYNWLGQISVAERQTMQTNLRTQGRGLQEEITKEIESAARGFVISQSEYRNKHWEDLINRYLRWRSSTRYSGLIKSVFIAAANHDEPFDLMRVDETARRLEPVSWPESFSGIRNRFASSAESFAINRSLKDLKEEHLTKESLIEHGFIDEDVPAMVRFLVNFGREEEPEKRTDRERRSIEEMKAVHELPLAIIVFDIDYIRQAFIPELFKRRFRVDGSIDYDLQVVKKYINNEKRDERVPNEALTVPGDLVMRVFIGRSSADFTRAPSWQILISHRSGSLEAAVAQARKRNLIVSFGILSLLALSTIIIILISRRAQRLARKQMDFVAGVSHEFRTPLAVIHAVSENLADGLITDSKQVEECGAVIRNDARRLAGMVEQVLEFAGVNRGKSWYQIQPVDIEGVFEDVLARYSTLEPRKTLRVEKQFEPNLPPVLADRGALECAVRNIIDNAVKYGGEPCWIGIKAHTRQDDRKEAIEISIADNGIGIKAADLDQIFEPFYRASDVVAAQIHGNGLGLSLVKKAVEANGGTISVSSTPGKGSWFTLVLPTANRNGDLNTEPAV